ncbi:MAG: hypothetical protein HYS25_13710 [Ignavibacteriales bacterium]|nr:hypothetical protein [Ignavibacteriales bacterium]
MKEAEKSGFIVQASAGLALLMCHEVQKENNLYEHVQYQCGLGEHPKKILRDKEKKNGMEEQK